MTEEQEKKIHNIFNSEIKDAFVEDAKTTRTLTNIKRTLDNHLEKYYNLHGADRSKVLNSILKIHGLHSKNFDFIGNIENLINEKLNDVSIDDNSNKSDKTIEALFSELSAPIKKAVGYDMLYRMIKALYGKDEAKRLTALMYDYTLALSDSTTIPRFYCYAIDASKLITIGRPFGQLQSKPVKRVSSYISSLCETVHQLSSHSSGAIAVGSFFVDVSALLFKNKVSLDQLKNDVHVKKELQNEFQQFVHSMNHLSRSSNESPFSNVSVFDRYKLKEIISDMSYLFAEENIDIEFLIEYVLEVEKIFLEFFDKGDPLKDGMPYRFPVLTINLSKDIYDNIMDLDLFNWVVNNCEIYRYNIFVSEGTHVATCCFDGNQEVNIKSDNKGERILSLKDLCDTEYDNDINYKVKYRGVWEKFKPVKVPFNDKKLINIVLQDGQKFRVTPDHIFPTLKGDVQAKDLKKSDLLKIDSGHIHKENTFIKIKNVGTRVYKDDFVYCLEKVEGSPYFTLPGGVITHNCRLLSDTDMFNLAGQSNSFGGTSISLGSSRVITLNLNRVALDAKTASHIYDLMDNYIESAYKILKAHKELLKLETEKGLQLFISNGWVSLDRMFSTLGIIGLVEMEETLTQKFNIITNDIKKNILTFINEKVLEYSKKYELFGNIEQIPGESMAVRLAEVDTLLYGKDLVPYKMYANQFVPLWKEATIFERLAEDGKYNKLLTGGGIVHAQIGEKVTPEQAKTIIEYATKCGCEHFALNAVYCQCENNHTLFGKLNTCSICGGTINDYYTRVVGFFTKVSSWNKTRRNWEFNERKFIDLQ